MCRLLDTRKHWSTDSAHFEIKVKVPRNLGPGRAVNGDRVNGEVNSFEEPFCRRMDRNHSC